MLWWTYDHACVGAEASWCRAPIVPICDSLLTMSDPALDCESFGTALGGWDLAGLLVGLPTVACDQRVLVATGPSLGPQPCDHSEMRFDSSVQLLRLGYLDKCTK